jgi:hypothetical protein
LRFVGGTFSDILYEGDKKTFVVDGKEHIIEVVIVDDTQHEVTLSVDGKMLNKLEEGDFSLASGVDLAVGDVYLQESADGKDFIRLFVGARSIELKDDASDTSFATSVKVNGKAFGEGLVKIRGQDDGSGYIITSISYRVTPEGETGGDVYVAPDDLVSEVLDEPAVLLGSIDFKYKGLDQPGSSELIFDPSGNSQYDLLFTNNQDHAYTVGLVRNAGGLEISDDGDTLHFLETASSSTFSVDTGDYLVLTDDNDHSGVTHIVRYQSIDMTGKNVQFDDDAEGSKTITYSGTEGSDASGELIVSGNTYRVFIGGAPDYNLAVDLDGDGSVDGSEAKIVVKGGGIVDLGSSETPGADFDMTLTTEGGQFDESHTNEVITLSMVKGGSTIDMALNIQSSLSIETDNDKTKAMSDYGVYIEKDNGNPDRMEIRYPLSQSLGVVTLAFASLSSGALTVEEKRCGNEHCDADEGYMNCPDDCVKTELKEEQPALVVKNICGDGVCTEDASSCPQDCVVVEQPAVVEPVVEKNFFARLWVWIVRVFT